MKALSEFKDEEAIEIVADLIEPIMDILTDPKNMKLKDEENALKMFSGFFKNSARKMMQIFAILSEEDLEEYTCDGVDVATNIATLVSDEKLVKLFISAGQTEGVNASAPASENITE